MKTIMLELTAVGKSKYPKGTRLLIKINKEAFLGTVTSTRQGIINVLCDDGDVIKVKEKSRSILGIAITRKVKKAIMIQDVEKYLKEDKNKKSAKKQEKEVKPRKPVSKSTNRTIINLTNKPREESKKVNSIENGIDVHRLFKEYLPNIWNKDVQSGGNTIFLSTKPDGSYEEQYKMIKQLLDNNGFEHKWGDNWYMHNDGLHIELHLNTYKGDTGDAVPPFYSVTIRDYQYRKKGD